MSTNQKKIQESYLCSAYFLWFIVEYFNFALIINSVLIKPSHTFASNVCSVHRIYLIVLHCWKCNIIHEYTSTNHIFKQIYFMDFTQPFDTLHNPMDGLDMHVKAIKLILMLKFYYWIIYRWMQLISSETWIFNWK